MVKLCKRDEFYCLKIMLYSILCLPLHQLFMVLVLRQTKDECRETITYVFRFMLMVLEGYLKRSWAVMPRIYFFMPALPRFPKSTDSKTAHI